MKEMTEDIIMIFFLSNMEKWVAQDRKHARLFKLESSSLVVKSRDVRENRWRCAALTGGFGRAVIGRDTWSAVSYQAQRLRRGLTLACPFCTWTPRNNITMAT